MEDISLHIRTVIPAVYEGKDICFETKMTLLIEKEKKRKEKEFVKLS